MSITLPEKLQQKVLKVADRVHGNYQRGYDQWGRRAKHKYDAINDTAEKKLARRRSSFGAEAAVAVLYSLLEGTPVHWGEGNRKKPDVGDWIEVKWSNWGGLPVARHDLWLSRPFILVTGHFPRFEVLGWAWGTDINGKKHFYVGEGDQLPGTNFPAMESSFIMPRELLNPWPAPPQFQGAYDAAQAAVAAVMDDYPRSAWDITGEEPWL